MNLLKRTQIVIIRLEKTKDDRFRDFYWQAVMEHSRLILPRLKLFRDISSTKKSIIQKKDFKTEYRAFLKKIQSGI